MSQAFHAIFESAHVFNLPTKSMASRGANSIDPDQTEPTMFAKKYF